MLTSDSFRDAMRAWATGIGLITAQTPTTRHGMTINSFTSVSLDPPLILVCIQNNLRILSLIREAGTFAVSVLRAEQEDLSKRFAGSGTEHTNRFEGLDTFTAVSGAPILKGVLAYFDCEVDTYHPGSTHTIVVAKVVAAERYAGEPLLYWDRDYRHLKV